MHHVNIGLINNNVLTLALAMTMVGCLA